MATPLPIFILLFISAAAVRQASAAVPPLCPRSDCAFIASLRSQCPLGIERSSAIEVSGDTLDRELNRCQEGVYYSVLFYASWCPFSRDIQPIFDALSSMYPQVTHLAVKESSAMPSVFSRYGVHSFPTILLLGNRTTRVQYYGSKDLSTLVHFYKETTGLDLVADFDVDQSTDLGNLRFLWPWTGSPKEIVANEPYLAFSLLFIFLKALIHVFPKIISCLKYLSVSYAWLLNLGIFGESSQLLEGALHAIDIKKLWNKFRLCNKARNFQNGAKNARVWASSLASVSLGEASSRTSHSA